MQLWISKNYAECQFKTQCATAALIWGGITKAKESKVMSVIFCSLA